MTVAAKTVYYFSFYLFATGIILIGVPNMLLQLVQLPSTQEVWIRVVGVLVFNIGYYYYRNARADNNTFLYSTVPTRIIVFLCFTTFALLQWISPVIIVFGSIDLLGAVCTWHALRYLQR